MSERDVWTCYVNTYLELVKMEGRKEGEAILVQTPQEIHN